MLAVKTIFSSCGRVITRSIHVERPKFDRFSRDSLRGRLHKQEIKDSLKTEPRKNNTVDAVIHADSIPVRPRIDILKALGFTLGVGATTYTIASIVDWERQKNAIRDQWNILSGLIKQQREFPREHDEVKELTPGEKCAVTLLIANCAVTALWRVKRIQPLMWRYFSNSFASRSLCSPMILSVFSHSSLIHLGLNMYVLWTFAHLSVDKFLGVEQFAAFYLTAGAVSSLTSMMHKAAVRSPQRALGASGAILAVLTYTCIKIPDARLKIVFIPHFNFSAENAVIGLILFDLAGLIFRFRVFDHAAHLGGALFGVAYALWGEKFMWGCWKKHVQKHWDKLTRVQ